MPISNDERLLHRLGYPQELFRGIGPFRNFAISFSIISILAGCLPSYFLAFHWGGPVSVTWGWLIVGVFTTFVALSMAEADEEGIGGGVVASLVASHRAAPSSGAPLPTKGGLRS